MFRGSGRFVNQVQCASYGRCNKFIDMDKSTEKRVRVSTDSFPRSSYIKTQMRILFYYQNSCTYEGSLHGSSVHEKQKRTICKRKERYRISHVTLDYGCVRETRYQRYYAILSLLYELANER